MSHKHCHKTKCKYHTFKDGNEKIIITKTGKAPRFKFCDQIRAFPIGHRICD